MDQFNLLSNTDLIHKQKMNDLNLDTEFDRTVQRDISKKLEELESEYEILKHIQTSALTGENIKNIFDEIIYYMLKKKSVDLENGKSEIVDSF